MAQKTILEVANAMFKNPADWKNIDDSDKKTYFFIFNRYMSKKYPELSQLLNDKLQDEIAGMNLIHAFLSRKPYPKWFWSKAEKKAEKSLFSDKELVSLQQKFEFTDAELEILIMYHSAEIKEELKYIKALSEEIK